MNTRTSLSKILTFILSLALILGVTPVTAFAEEAAPECVCESLCAEGSVNEACPVCAEDFTLCEFEAEPDPETETPSTDGSTGPVDEPSATATDGVSLGESGDTATPTDTTPGVIITIVPESEYISLSIPQGVPITDDTLLKGVSAVDENGEAVTVTVSDIGGLDRENPQPQFENDPELGMMNKPYTITYSTPGVDDVTRECYVTVGIVMLATGTWDCGATENTVAATLDDNGTLTVSGAGAMADYASGTAVPWYDQRADIQTVTISDGVTNIGDRAFFGCNSLTSANIPAGVTEIGDEAFRRCNSLASVILPNGVTSIGSSAFRGCAFTSVTIPNSVTTIGERAFQDCTNLTSVTNLGSVTEIANSVFNNCVALTDINIPAGVETIGDDAFRGCKELESIDLPGNLTAIGAGAFQSCPLLKIISIPDNVKTIDIEAFRGCASLETIHLPDSVTTIDNNAFYGCTSLESVTLPSGITTIEFGMFDGCTSLEAVIIPKNVTAIGNGAFHNCDALITLTIPPKVVSIGRFALGGCKNLTEVIFEGETAPAITFTDETGTNSAFYDTADNEFEGANPNLKIYYPKNGKGYDSDEFTNYIPVGALIASDDTPPAPTPTPSPNRDNDDDDNDSPSRSDTTPSTPTETWMTAGNITNPSRSTGKFGVRAAAWARMAGPYYHDSMSGNAVQVRAYFDSPGLFTKDTYVSGWTSGADAGRLRGFFEKWFSNKIRAIHFDQPGQWERQIRVAAKLDLAGWDMKRLYFYVYDPKLNSCRCIADPAYWLDANGYLHFKTGYAGEIIISEGELEKR